MKFKVFATAIVASIATPLALAGATTRLGIITRLPLVEGGLFAVAVVGLVAGVRIVRAKHNRKR